MAVNDPLKLVVVVNQQELTIEKRKAYGSSS